MNAQSLNEFDCCGIGLSYELRDNAVAPEVRLSKHVSLIISASEGEVASLRFGDALVGDVSASRGHALGGSSVAPCISTADMLYARSIDRRSLPSYTAIPCANS